MNNLGINYKPKIILVSLFLGLVQIILGQQLSTELSAKLPAQDQKKLQKADQLYLKGKKIEDEINPTAKEERKSQLKYLEAADNYQNANSTRNKVYTNNIKIFWKKYTGEKNLLDFAKKEEVAASDSFKKAQQIRNTADKERKLSDRIQRLIQAEKLEGKSLVMMQKVLYTYLSWPVEYDHLWVTTDDPNIPTVKKQNKQIIEVTPEKPKDTTFTKDVETKPPVTNFKTSKKGNEAFVGNDSSLYGKVKVNEDQIDKFNSFLQKKYPTKYEDYVINFQELDYSNINAMREAWYKYQYGYLTTDTVTMLAADQDSIAKEQQVLANAYELAQAEQIKDKSKPIKPGDKQLAATVKTTVKPTINKDKSRKTTNSEVAVNKYVTEESTTGVTGGFIFRVQVAACRVPLDRKILNNIYNGSLQVLELNEDNWYKYAIGEFTTYKSARQLRDQSSIPGAFVIAYLNGKRIKITPAIAYKKYTGTIRKEGLNPVLINYRIQIAASKINLSDNHLKNIYNGPIKIEMVTEDGWNKYYLSAGKTYQEAKNLLDQVAIPGAFILAYQQNTRIDIQTATKLTK